MPARRAGYDPVGDFICDMLLDSDQRESEKTASEPQWYKIEPVDPYEGMSAKEKLQAKRRKKIPSQTSPQKLHALVAESVKGAAVQTLAKYGQGLEKCYRRSAPANAEVDTVTLSNEDTGVH